MRRKTWLFSGCLGLFAVVLLGLLLLLGATTDIPLHYGLRCFTALAMENAVSKGDLPAVKRIVRRHHDMVNCTNFGFKGEPYTVLGTAIQDGRTDVTSFLLDHGADPNARSHFSTPVNAAVAKGDEKAVRVLVAHGAHLKCKDNESALETAIACKNWRMCKLLRRLGENDVPLVIEAVAQGNTALLEREVRKNRAILNSRFLGEFSLFHVAVRFGQAGSIRVLARLGADINYSDPESLSGPPIALACQNGSMAMIKTLVECGARLEWPGTETERENGLYYAVLGSHPDVVRYLLGKGLDPNVTRVAITDFLIADSGCESNEARTHREMAKMLVSKGFTADKAVLRQRIAPQGQKSALESYLWKHSK